MKTKTAALVLGAFSAITLWSRPTIDNFFCDFEWMPEPLYYFLDFSQLNYKILHEDINGFLRISGKEPSSRLALPMEINMFYRKILEFSLIVSQIKADSWRFEKARERYNLLLKNHPEVIKRAPLSHIASYLLMTPETLSRVRSGIL